MMNSTANPLRSALCRCFSEGSRPMRRVASLLTVAVLATAGAGAQQYNYAGGGCTATYENRTTLIDTDGTWVIPNVPEIPGQWTVHIVCPQLDGTVLDAYSPYYNLLGTPGMNVPLLPISTPFAQPQGLVLAIASGSLGAAGSQLQLATLQVFADGTAQDATLGAEGTSYYASNPAVATVSPDGLVTAVGAGSLTITANNNGLVATIQIPSFASLDSDGDGMPDAWEIANGLNPYDPTDAALDPDGDGLTNLQEYQLGTNPHVADTDGDGLTDGQEVKLGTNPLLADTDGDGLSDGQEVALGTNPLLADTDGDGIPDGVEVKIGTNPLVPDATTVITGYVTNADGTPSVGTSTVVLTYFNALTDSTGKFTILTVPVTLGNVIATAEAVINTKVYSGSTQSITPVPNGVTNVGTIVLGQNGGQVSGTVTTPDKKPDPGVQVVVTGGADTRSAVTDSNGLYAVSGLPVGQVFVAAIDPATSLRGQATGALSGSAPLTLNVQLASFGTVSGLVTDLNGNPVPAGVTVTITGSLNASTVTDGVGHYSFTFVPLGAVTVDATDTNGNHGRTQGTVTATAQTIVANVQYLGQGTVSGTVADGNGNASPGATVTLVNNGVLNQRLTATANSAGQYSIPHVFIGTLNLTAQSTLAAITGNATAAVTTNAQTVTANITLQPTGNLSGVVYRVDGATPVPNATVSLLGTAQSTTADANGAYTLTSVPLGRYNLSATDQASPDAGVTTVTLTNAGQTVTANVSLLGLSTVVVTVVDGGGNPSTGAATVINTGGPFYQAQTGVSGTDGTVTFHNVLAVSNLVSSATNPVTGLGGKTNSALTANQTVPVTITLQSAGTIQGTVFQSDGVTLVGGISVGSSNGAQTLTAANGTYALTNIPSGTYNVGVYDAVGNQLSISNGLTISTQGQIVTSNFIIIGRGTVTGNVTFSNGTAAAGVSVQISSSAPNAGNLYGAATDVNGNYSIQNVPVGAYTAIGQQHTLTTNSYGTAAGSLTGNGATSVTNIVLSSQLVPSSVVYNDANGFQYAVHQDGSLYDGSFGVFVGDGQSNRGASLLSLIQNGQTTAFTGEDFAPADLNGRQISYTQSGLGGLTVTRRVYVPVDGYFARYLELISNPGVTPVTVGVQLTTNFGLAGNATILNNTYYLSSDVPQIVTTSSGDQILNINDPTTPDHWLTLGGATDRDPFLPDAGHIDYVPTVADVFDAPGAALTPTSAVYNNNFSATNSQLTETYGNVTVPAGGTVGILHFLSQENLYESAAAAATRLEQLPPEALAGLSQSDLATVMNFPIPSGGVSTLPALSTLTNQVAGTVYAYDGVTPVPNAPVFFTSSDPIYARFYEGTADGNGNYNFQGTLGGIPVPYEPFSMSAWEPTNVTPSTAVCRQEGLFLGAGCAIISPGVAGTFDATSGATTTTANAAFTNTGILTGTVSRGPNVLNAAGTVTLSGGGMLPVTVNIKSDGTYTFLDVLPGSYNLLASVNNTLLTGLATTTINIGQTTTTNITIIEAGTVTGAVTRPDSSLAIGDTVNLRIAGQNPLVTSVDTSGHYAFTDVPIGAFEVDCYDSLTNTAATATGTVANGVTLTENLALQSAGGVSGTVSSNDGSSVSGLTVTLTSATSSGTQSLSTVTNTTGAFSFTNVKPGTIVLRATNPEGLQGTSTGSLPIAGQNVTLNISLLAAGNLQGTVFQGDGTTPAANINVTLSPAPLTGPATVMTNASGVYNFSNVQVGFFNVAATNPVNGDQGSANGQIQVLNQQRTVNITLNGFGNLAVTVLSPTNAAVPDASVTVTTLGIGSTHTGTTNANGVAQFTGLFVGPYSVSAKDPVSGLSTYNGGNISYNQNATVTLTLQALATIQGTIFQPDGVTPQAGATVTISGQGTSVVTGPSGTYQFPNIPTGYYTITAQDSNGRTRAYANSVQLQGNGSTLTVNLTFIGTGSVSGTVLNADGTVAVNASLTLTSQNPILGGSQTTNTLGDGTYSFGEVPVGKVTVSMNYLPAGQIGYGSGTITTGQNTVINIQVQGNAITLPVTLTDADGYPYSIYVNGTYYGNGESGGLDPFFGTQALGISVGGTQQFFGNNAQGSQTGSAAIQSLNGQQLELTAPVNGLNVTRKIYVPSNGYFARRLDVLQNPTSSTVTATVTLGFGGGYERSEKNSAPALITSSNGTTTLTPTVLWTVDDDDTGLKPYPMTAPAIASVFQGTGAPISLSAISYPTTSYFVGYGNSQYFINNLAAYYTYNTVTIPANGQVSFLFFSAKEATQGTATTAAQRLVQLPPEALAGLTDTDLASVVNFVVPNPQTLSPVAQPAGGTLSGQVVAGDNVTPVPNAAVYVQSTDLLYGSGLTTVADASGNYTIPSLLANTFAAEAIDPVTNITSAVTTGAFPMGATAQTQNIPFTGTGIMRGQIQPTGKTVVTSANVYAYFDCPPNNTYCGQAGVNTGTSNVWNFLTVPAGFANLSANVNTSTAGGYYLTQNGISIPAGLTTYVTLTLPGTGNVTGVVTNADGTPAVGVSVTTTPATNGFYETVTTAADGSYSFTGLALDTYTITATDPLTTTPVSQTTVVTQDTTNTVNLQFVGKGTVNLSVRFANGNIAANANVYLFIGNEANIVNYYAPCQRDPQSHCSFALVTTDANGNATILNVPDGPFVVHAYYPNQGFYSTTNSTMTGNAQTVALPVSLTPVGTISGTLTYPTGATVPSAYINIVDASGLFNTNAQTDSAGNYAFFPVPADRPVTLTSSTTIAGRTAIARASNQQIPGDGQTLTVNLRYPGAATVQVNLQNADGTTYTKSNSVTVVIKSADGQQNYSANLSGGSATFTNVLEAPFVAYAYDYSIYPAFAIGSTSFTLLPADDGTTKTVNILAAPTGTVQGTLYAADGTTVIQTGYNVTYLDVTTGINNQTGPSFPPGYSFSNVTSGAGGFTITPSLYLPGSGTVNYTNLAFSGSISTQGQTITQNFTLPVSVVSGTVYLNDGVTPAPNVNVSAQQTITGNSAFFGTTTDANGNYQILGVQTGQLNIGASDANGVSGFAVITVPSNTAILTNQNITLAAAGTVIGTVYDSSSNPQSGITVTLSPSANNGGVQITATTDSNGNYNAPDIPVGSVSVSATLNDGTVETNTGTLVTNGSTITVNLGTAPPSGTIFGTVYDSTQTPAPGATVTATSQTNGNTFTATTDGNGLYTITGVGLDTLSVAAVLSDGVTTVTPTIGTVTDLTVPVEIDLGLLNAGNVSGAVTDSTGAPLPNVNINSFSTGDTSSSTTTSTDGNGNYYIGGLAPGTVTIQVLDVNNNVTGSNTGVLPFGGNVTINVQTTQVGALLHMPKVPAPAGQTGTMTLTATQRAAALARPTQASSLTHGALRAMVRTPQPKTTQTAVQHLPSPAQVRPQAGVSR